LRHTGILICSVNAQWRCRCSRLVRPSLRQRQPTCEAREVAAGHKFAELEVVPVSLLADVEVLLPAESAAIEWIEFVTQFCGKAGVR
jgi:hypothetical protein